MDRKKSFSATKWGVPSSTMKTPTRLRSTIGGAMADSSSKINSNNGGGQARFSIGSVPASARRPSVFRSITCAVKDTRPLSSKEYQNEMIRRIYNFLLEHDGENCISERVIRSPTKQDFICMFESIYQHLNPDFQIKNVLEEVPAIFRGLGYPTAIKASTLQTIGASHSWPTLLGALTWLVEVVEVKNSLQGQAGQNLLLGGDDSDGALKAYKYSWLNAGFRKYQENRDAINDEEFFADKIRALRNWYEQQEDFDAQQQTIRTTLEQIKEECAELEANKRDLEGLREDIARLDDDITKAVDYKEETENDIIRFTKENNGVKAEIEACGKIVNDQRLRVAELEALTTAQEEGEGLKSGEARELAAEIDQNKLTIRKLASNLEDLSKQYWLSVPKTKNAFAEQHDRYHKMVLDIKNFCSVLHCMDAVVIKDNVEDGRALYEAVLNVKPLLEDIEVRFLQRKWDLSQCIRQSTSELEAARQECDVESGRIRERQRMESRAARQRKRDREEWDKDIIAAEADLDRLENEKEVLENKRHEVGSMKRDIECQKAENLEYSKLLAEKKLQISDAVLSRFYQIVSDLDMIKEAREWIMRTMQEFCDLMSQTDEGFTEE